MECHCARGRTSIVALTGGVQFESRPPRHYGAMCIRGMYAKEQAVDPACSFCFARIWFCVSTVVVLSEI